MGKHKKNAVIKGLVRAAKKVMKQPEFAPRTDGVTWRHGAAWDGLHDAVRCGREIYPIERAAMTSEARLQHALERCRAWNIRHGNWSQEMEELVDAALAVDAREEQAGDENVSSRRAQ
jgi:hypothetical protein